MRIIAQNLRPIALIVLCTAVGALLGHAFTGFLIGVIIIALVTLFL